MADGHLTRALTQYALTLMAIGFVDRYVYNMRIIIVLMLIVIAGGCGLNKEKLRQEGYQVFEKYSIAIKLPCDLQVDNTVTTDSTIGEYVVMVCPQIFKDTSRTSFHLDRLLASRNVIYHLNILTNSTLTPIEMLVDRQKQILQLLDVDEFEEIDIEGKKALIYEIESKKVTAASIPDELFIYEIAVSGDSLRREKLNEILKTVKFGTFK
jgi:hypothetical protein